jgi:hypothetical protein
MTAHALNEMVSCQEALIGALDANDPAAITAAAASLDAAVIELRRTGVPADIRDALPQALALNQAARVRVNFLTDNVRRRLDALAAIRGTASGLTYRPAAR